MFEMGCIGSHVGFKREVCGHPVFKDQAGEYEQHAGYEQLVFSGLVRICLCRDPDYAQYALRRGQPVGK